MNLNRDYIIQIIKFYGFIECGQILSFLTFVCLDSPDGNDLTWIYNKINQCLINNNNGSDYFYDLVQLKTVIEIDFMD